MRHMLAAELPGRWQMLEARIDGGRIVARYVDGAANVVVELDPATRVAARTATACFGVGVRATTGGDVRALVASVLGAVRAAEPGLAWLERNAVRGAPIAPMSQAEALATLRAIEAGGDVSPAKRQAALLHHFRALESRGRHREALALGEAHDDVELALLSAWLREMFRDLDGAARNARVALGSPLRGTRLAAAKLLARAGHHDEAKRAADQIASERPSDVAMVVDLASLYEASEADAAAVQLYERALELDASSPDATLALGHRRAWMGDAEGARRHAEQALSAAPGPAEQLLGIACALEGAHAEAMLHFERACVLRPFDAVTGLWRAETWMRLGLLERAREEAQRARDLTAEGTSHVPALVLRAAISERLGVEEPEEPVLRDAMRSLVPQRTGDLVRDLDAALHAMCGNRGTPTTYLEAGTLRRIVSPPAPRLLAKNALHRFVLAESPEDCEEDFARIEARFPALPEPHNYHGEMWLHAGVPVRARACFERALSLNPRSRWAFIGLAGVELLEARPEAALSHLARGIELAGGPGPTTYVYRGEAQRLLGRRAEARADLDHTLAQQPSRIGAWVNLGLLAVEVGDEITLRRALEALARRAGAFVDDATAEVGTDAPGVVLGRMLVMLRGNRASGIVTYYTADGRLRVVPPAAATDVYVAPAR